MSHAESAESGAFSAGIIALAVLQTFGALFAHAIGVGWETGMFLATLFMVMLIFIGQ